MNYLYRFFSGLSYYQLIIPAIFLNFAILHSEYKLSDTFEVGVRPAGIYTDKDGALHIFCSGWDGNYNTIYEPDSGDIKPTHWKLSKYLDKPVLISNMEWPPLDIPFRPYTGNEYMYLPHGDKIEIIKLKDAAPVDSIIGIKAAAVSEFLDYLVLSIRIDENQDWVIDTNLVVIYDMAQGIPVDTLGAWHYVQQTLPFQVEGRIYLAVLCEGNFFVQDDSKLLIYSYNNEVFTEEKSINIGSGGNHIYLDDNFLVVTSNGSRDVHFILVDTFEEMFTISIPTSEWDGPRESMTVAGDIWGDYLAVSSCWDGNVYMYNPFEEMPNLKAVETAGKAESMQFMGEDIYVAHPYKKGSYNPSNLISKLSKVTSAGIEKAINVNVYPNPASEYIIIDGLTDLNKASEFEIYSIEGKLISKIRDIYFNVEKAIISLSRINLSNGVYILRTSDTGKEKYFQITIMN
jgi:hypothetical protein